MRAFLGSFEFNVVDLSGFESISYGYHFIVVLSGKDDFLGFPIDDEIKLDHWKGRVVEWSQEYTGVHDERFYRCVFVSNFQVLCRSKKYYIYKNLDYKSIIKNIFSKISLEVGFFSKDAQIYDQFVQYGDSYSDFIKYLISINQVFMCISPKNNSIVFADDFRWAKESVSLKYRPAELGAESAISNLKAVKGFGDVFGESKDPLCDFNGMKVPKLCIDCEVFYSIETHNLQISVGCIVNLEGDVFNGKYIAIQVKHKFNINGYINEVLMILIDDNMLVKHYQIDRIPGPQAAVVCANRDHCMVDVLFPWSEDQSLLLPVLQLFAGNQYGSFFVPRVGERVLVSFEDRFSAFVHGSFYDISTVPAHNSFAIESIKTQSIYEKDKFVEIMIDNRTNTLTIDSSGQIEENLGSGRVTKIEDGSFVVDLANGSAKVELSKTMLMLSIKDGKLRIKSQDLIIESASVDIHYNNLKLTGDEIMISSNKIKIDTKNSHLSSLSTEIISPEISIKSSKIDIS